MSAPATDLRPITLKFNPHATPPPSTAAPKLPAGKREISWLGRSPTGEDQRIDGPCGIFAYANIVGACKRIHIPVAQRFKAYDYALKLYKLPSGSGLYVEQVNVAAMKMKWVEDGTQLNLVDPDAILEAPLLEVDAVNEVIDKADARGTWLHTKAARASKIRGYHAQATMAYGWVGAESIARWLIENSWLNFGTHGIGTVQDHVHRVICKALYKINSLPPIP